jgi:hypothetical protein
VNGNNITVALDDNRFYPIKQQMTINSSLMVVKVVPYCFIQITFRDKDNKKEVREALMAVNSSRGFINMRPNFYNGALRVLVPREHYIENQTNFYTVAVTGSFKEFKQTI